MKHMRFDIEDLEVKKCTTKYEEYTAIEAKLIVRQQFHSMDEVKVAEFEIHKDNGSYGYSVKMNELHEVEFKYATMYIDLFLKIVGNIKVPEGGLEFHYRNFAWVGDFVNEAFCTYHEALKMDLI